MLMEIEHLENFLNKLQRMLEKHPEEAQRGLSNALYHVIYAVFFAGYIRGKDPDFDYNYTLSEIFGRFSTDEWKEVNGEVFFYDEDYFRVLTSDALDLAERLYPIIKKLMATEPIKGPIGRVVFKVDEEKGEKDEG
jgi:hypothetical protein